MLNYQKTFIYLLFAFFEGITFAQPAFLKVHKTTEVNNRKTVTQLPDSGYFVASSSHLSGSNSYQTYSRLDKYGEFIWNQKATSTTSGISSFTSMYTSNNKILTAGGVSLSGNSYLGVNVLDLDGNSISYKLFPYSNDYYEGVKIDVAELNQELYALASNKLVKMDSVGNVIWTRAFASNKLNLMKIHPISSTKIILTGFADAVQYTNSNYDIVQVCIDTSGATLWSNSYGTNGYEKSTNSVYSNGKIYQVGEINDYASGRSGIFVFCSDTLGNQNWFKWVDELLPQANPKINVLKDGTFIITSSSSNKILRISNEGTFISATKIQYFEDLYLSSLTETNDGGIFIESRINDSIYKIKLDAGLNSSCITMTNYFPSISLSSQLNKMPLICSNQTSTTFSGFYPTWSINTNFPVLNRCSNNCDIVSNFTASKTDVCLSENVNFTNLASQGLNYEWWIDSVLVSTDYMFSYSFSNVGLHKVVLKVSNSNCSSESHTFIKVNELPQSPVFSFSTEDYKAKFNTVVENNCSVKWDYGDNTHALGYIDSTTHYYNQFDIYNVCLTSTNSCGSTTSCQDVNIRIDSVFQFVKFYNELSFYSGRSWGSAVLQLKNGGFLLSGIDDSWGSSGMDVTVIRTDRKGNPLRRMIIANATNSDFSYTINSMNESRTGHILLGASTTTSPFLGIMSPENNNSVFLKLTTNSTGATSARPYEKENGNIIFSGSYGNRAFIAETTPSLGVVWFKRHSGLKTLFSTVKIPNGYLSVGRDSTNTRIGILKLDQAGDVVFSKAIQILNNTTSIAHNVFMCKDGNFVCTGSTDNKTYLMKFDTNANVLWTKLYTNINGNTFGIGRTVTEDLFGNFIIVSSTGNVIKADSLGNGIVAFAVAGSGTNRGSIRHCQTHDGGIAIAGTNYYFSDPGEDMSMYRLTSTDSLSSCISTWIQITTSTLNTIVSNVNNNALTGIPNLTRTGSGVLYAAYQHEHCILGSAYFEAQFSYSNQCATMPIEFSDLSTGEIISREWHFNGGNPENSTDINPQVIWSTPGTYDVSLTVTDTNGISKTKHRTITISDLPVANAGSDLIRCPGDTVSLIANGIGVLTWNQAPEIINNQNSIVEAICNTSTNFILTASSGNCVQTDTVTIFVLEVFRDTLNTSICFGENFEFQNQYFSSPGLYSISFESSNGCDSLLYLNLSVINIDTTQLNISICQGENYTFDGSIYNETGQYLIPLVNQFGCDSIIELNLLILENDTTQLHVSICQGENYIFDGSNYNETGQYLIPLINQFGCDSIIELNLLILENDTTQLYVSICPGENYSIGDSTFHETGQYVIPLVNQLGCDSLIQLNLNIYETSISQLNINSCINPYTYNNESYTESGQYTHVLTNSLGCDSTVILDLYFYPPLNTIVTIDQFTLTSLEDNATYQWVDCVNDFAYIPGETNQSFNAMSNGSYAVILSSLFCEETEMSSCFVINGLTNNELSSILEKVLIYPNPTNGTLTIETNTNENKTISILDSFGKMIYYSNVEENKTLIDLSKFASGVYSIEIKTKHKLIHEKILKF